MKTAAEIHALLDEADPVGDDAVLDMAALTSRIETALGRATAPHENLVELDTDNGEAADHPAPLRPRPRVGRRGPLVALASAAALLILTASAIVVALSLGGADELPVAGDTPSAVTRSGASDVQTAGGTLSAVVWKADIEGLVSSGGYLWAWDQREIKRYSDGRWETYSATPSGAPFDVAFGSGTLWAVSGADLSYFDGDEWQWVEESPRGWRIDHDPTTGAVWLSTGEDLYRWHDGEMDRIGHPANWPDDSELGLGYVGDIAVSADGSVWAGGLFGYLPHLGALSRYDDGDGSWEISSPLGPAQRLPAWSLAAGADGSTWVLLVDVDEVVIDDPRLYLARRDVEGAWTIRELPSEVGVPMDMAVQGDVVWFAQGSSSYLGRETGGLFRFDGESWTRWLPATVAHQLAAAPDGSVWLADEVGLRSLEP